MTRVQLSDGTCSSDPDQILNEQKSFYEDLYKENPEVRFNLNNPMNICVTEEDNEHLNAPITLKELTQAVKKLKRNKSPGCDGFSAEFYQFFWEKIGSLYHKVLNQAISDGVLHLSAQRGIITLIPKKDKNILLIGNWRPLTMLNMDYKILATVLATRLKPVLNRLVSKDQTGFLVGRKITTTIWRTMDVIDLANKLEIPGYLICADFVKCFDLISYSGIRGSLRFFGIGKQFINYVDLLLTQFESCVTNNGYLSQWFNVTRSCHQGCPLAPYLMLACGEVMAIMLKNNPDTKPLHIKDQDHIISQFADGTQFFTPPEPKAYQAIQHTLQLVEHNIGFKINTNKPIFSPWVMLKSNQDVSIMLDHTPFCLAWTPCQEALILKQAEGVLLQWVNRSLTITGKVMVVNTLVGSLYGYVMQCVENPPDSFFDQHNALVHKFLWQHKRAKIVMKLLQCSKHNGGLKLVNVRHKCMSLKIQWLFTEDPGICDLLMHFIPESLGTRFWDCQLESQHVKMFLNKDTPKFWIEVIVMWFDYRQHIEKETETHLGNQLICATLR